jgi:di/tricarboxylate transporter
VSDAAITFCILGAAVAVFVWDRLPVAVVAVGVALALWATGVLGYEDALAGFGDPTVVFIASLFVISDALDATGVTAWLGRRMLAGAGDHPGQLTALIMLLVAGLTAVITPNGSVAALVPAVVLIAIRLRRAPSRLLLPLAFGAHAGSLLALTGSPVNVIVSDAARDTAGGGFGYFEFALVGIPLVVGTIAIVALAGDRLVPERRPRTMPPDFSEHARTLVAQYGLDDDEDGVLTRHRGLAEVLIPPRSQLTGSSVFPGMTTDSGELVVVAVHREGEDIERETTLRVGDALLLQGTWSALDEQLRDPDVLVVDTPAAVRRHAVPLGAGARRALAVLAVMVVALATGALPPAVAGLLAAGALVVTGVTTIEQCYRAISWTTVILVAGMIPLSTAMIRTGAADDLARAAVDTVGSAGPRALLLALVLLTVVLGQLISNTATALIMIPVALSAANELDVSPRPLLMGLAVAAAASFMTPVATPANLMVMDAGGYRFGDYWRLGLPLLALFGVVAVVLVPVLWSF